MLQLTDNAEALEELKTALRTGDMMDTAFYMLYARNEDAITSERDLATFGELIDWIIEHAGDKGAALAFVRDYAKFLPDVPEKQKMVIFDRAWKRATGR